METEAARVDPIEVEPAELNLTEVKPYTVGTNDVLTVTFTGLTDQFAQNVLTVRVHDNGERNMVMLPMIGEIDVTGLSLKGIERALYDALVPTYVKDMSVYVQLVGPESTTVIVVGAAGESGLITLPQNERNVLYALSRATGFGPTGSGRIHVKPIRTDRPELVYDMTSIHDLRRALLAPPLESGDMIVVESAAPSVVFVIGLVNSPGLIPVPQNGKLSLVRTIAAAGGLRDLLYPEEATLWRRLPDGKQVRVKIDIDDVMSGESPDIQLCAGDVLDVPHTGETRFREWAITNIRFGPFGVTAMYDPVADYRARILRNDNNNNDWLTQTIRQTLGTGIADIILPPVTP